MVYHVTVMPEWQYLSDGLACDGYIDMAVRQAGVLWSLYIKRVAKSPRFFGGKENGGLDSNR